MHRVKKNRTDLPSFWVALIVVFSVFSTLQTSFATNLKELKSVNMHRCLFDAIFQNIGGKPDLTALRMELKAVVSKDTANGLLNHAHKIVGQQRITLRDVPKDPTLEFVTSTNYFRSVRGKNMGDPTHGFKGVIRVREYIVVPKGTAVESLTESQLKKLPRVKLADGRDHFVKVEFKIGHPEPDASGKLTLQPGVVDKPGIVLSKRDVALLFSTTNTKATFDANWEAVLARGKKLQITGRDGIARPVNDYEELRSLIQRIGLLHEVDTNQNFIKPVMNVRYKREARKIRFDHPTRKRSDGSPESFDVQLTIDRDIEVTDLIRGEKVSYSDADRVIEFKLPIEFSNMSDAELRKVGLHDLADLRKAYLELPIQPETKRNSGKRARGVRMLEEKQRLKKKLND